MHRVDAMHLTPPNIAHLRNIQLSRERLVNGRFHVLQTKWKEGQSLGEDPEEDGETEGVKMVVKKCYSSLTVSTNDGRKAK